MELPTIPEILASIDRFLERHGNMAPTRFGREATREPQLIESMRNGRIPNLGTLHRVKAYMDAKDAEAGCGADHADGDTASADEASCGKADEVSAAQVLA
ncbi:hypothetical protein [Sphingomonas sp. S2-65]|uniref:hypothetical protein n=1 Tax=Sphingomonas sp. S2-65 TaxID=2903960 RepID=UPI001F3323E4|nr:hypothetical protein [Sphingomonas sp. S2-65]UYY60129.1 hypothetical protein LZ586_08645 [Sphingomonas sp. S2-65]